MRRQMPTAMPVCQGRTRSHAAPARSAAASCPATSPAAILQPSPTKETRFVLTILKMPRQHQRGGERAGISYPTVKSRLEAVISRLGLTATPSSEELKQQRLQTLDRLRRSEITPDQAAEILKNLNL